MTYLKLSPVEFRPSRNDVAVLFLIEFARPNGKPGRLYVAIEGQSDITDAIAYLKHKFRPSAIALQPSLFHTWSWETELVQALHDEFLTPAD